jgi:hypothetical protein
MTVRDRAWQTFSGEQSLASFHTNTGLGAGRHREFTAFPEGNHPTEYRVATRYNPKLKKELRPNAANEKARARMGNAGSWHMFRLKPFLRVSGGLRRDCYHRRRHRVDYFRLRNCVGFRHHRSAALHRLRRRCNRGRAQSKSEKEQSSNAAERNNSSAVRCRDFRFRKKAAKDRDSHNSVAGSCGCRRYCMTGHYYYHRNRVAEDCTNGRCCRSDSSDGRSRIRRNHAAAHGKSDRCWRRSGDSNR